MTAYFLRIRHRTRPISGNIQLPVETMTAARALAGAWVVALGDKWVAEVLDGHGVSVWTVRH